MEHRISADRLTIKQVSEILKSRAKISLGPEAETRIIACRDYLDKRMERDEAPIYGINTGFGSLCNTIIDRADLQQLQKNLVMSHACGCGPEIESEIVRLMLLLKIQGLSYGHSGVTVETVQRLVDMYNLNMLPVVYEQGSLGASGDLSPLAHLSLPLLGLGEVNLNGKRMSSEVALNQLNLQSIALRSKEGLALLNGTQFMSSYSVYCTHKANHLLDIADLVAALSIEGFDARPEPFSDEVHIIRQQAGQLKVARNIRKILSGSESFAAAKAHVQDPYSFRCIPQVHGASRDAVKYIENVVENEINAVTDNPTIFPDSDEIISAGNFHGQPLAISLDFLAIAMAEIGSISERRTYKLLSGTRNLPAFLSPNPGLNSGFMIPQYTAASLVSKNKQLCTPCSVDTIDSSNGQEDHVSMGANAAVKALQVLRNVENILAIELFNAAQACDLRKDLKTSSTLEKFKMDYRRQVEFIENDTIMYKSIEKSKEFIENLDLSLYLKNEQ